MQVKTFTYQSSQIFYHTLGKGKPVMLLHGFGEDGDIWEKQVELLEDHCLLIIPDLPGSGKSEMIPDMSMEGMAELLKDLLDFELLHSSPSEGGWEGAALFGHSMGGYITLAFAEKYPDQLSSLGLIHSSAFADNDEKKANRLKSIDFIKKHGAYEFLKSSIPPLFKDEWASANQSVIDELVEKSKAFSSEAIIQYYQAMINRPDRTAVLKSFSGPILFIIGEHDKAVPFEQSMQQCYLPARSHIHILRNSAHMGMQEETTKLNNAMLDLVNSI